MSRPIEGLLLVDKPLGPTSHDVVSQIRRQLGVKRVGHAGTLDPAAEGLLPIVVGSATRLVRFLPPSPKSYRGSLRLGVTTDTDDATGTVLSSWSGAMPRLSQVIEAAHLLEGRSSQVPPAFSARKVQGQRLHRHARRGQPITAPSAEVFVQRFELLPTTEPSVFEFDAEVSSGTYVRALARDLGRSLGCGGSLLSLQRTAIGPMRLTDAIDLPAKADPNARARLLAALIAPSAMPLGARALALPDLLQVQRFLRGAAIAIAEAEQVVEPMVRVLDPAGDLLGMAEPREGVLHPRVVLRND